MPSQHQQMMVVNGSPYPSKRQNEIYCNNIIIANNILVSGYPNVRYAAAPQRTRSHSLPVVRPNSLVVQQKAVIPHPRYVAQINRSRSQDTGYWRGMNRGKAPIPVIQQTQLLLATSQIIHPIIQQRRLLQAPVSPGRTRPLIIQRRQTMQPTSTRRYSTSMIQQIQLIQAPAPNMRIPPQTIQQRQILPPLSTRRNSTSITQQRQNVQAHPPQGNISKPAAIMVPTAKTRSLTQNQPLHRDRSVLSPAGAQDNEPGNRTKPSMIHKKRGDFLDCLTSCF